MVEVMNNQKQVEEIKIEGVIKSTAKTYEGFMQGKINHFMRFPKVKYTGHEIEMLIRGFIQVHNKFYPEMKATVLIKQYKGVSGIEIRRFPNYFQTIEHRKKENGDGEIEFFEERHKILREDIEPLIKAIERLEMKKKYKTRYIAQEYLKMAEIEVNSKGRRFFDEKGFDFEGFFGDRKLYIPFNIMLKILDYYDFIHYYKSGCVERLKDNFEVQKEFL